MKTIPGLNTITAKDNTLLWGCNEGDATQDGKMRLDAIASYMNGKINTLIVPISSSITVTVGSGGNYATINDALNYASRYYPLYVKSGIAVTIRLLSGFVMTEQIIVNGIDLGWITISSNDATVTINRASLTTSLASYYPAFGATNGGTLPIINTLFVMNTTGSGGRDAGIVLYNRGNVIVSSGKGVQSASIGIYLISQSEAYMEGSDFRYSSSRGILCQYGSKVHANLANVSYAGGEGIYCDFGSTIDARLATITNCGIGVSISKGSFIDLHSATISSVSGAGILIYGLASAYCYSTTISGYTYAILIDDNSHVNVNNSTLSSTTNHIVRAQELSRVNLRDCTIAAPPSTYNTVNVGSGSVAYVSGTITGASYNIATNTFTPNGIIYV